MQKIEEGGGPYRKESGISVGYVVDSDESCKPFQCKVATRSKAKLPVIGA